MTNTESINPPESQTTDADARLNEKLLADQCLDLLCKQEKTLWLLGQANEKAQNDESLELIWQMLIQFLDFAEKHFNKEEFASIAEPLHEVHARTADHKQKLNTHAWKLVRSMIGFGKSGRERHSRFLPRTWQTVRWPLRIVLRSLPTKVLVAIARPRDF